MHFDWTTGLSVFSYLNEALFIKEIKIYICTLYIVFLFVKMEIDNLIKEIAHVLRAFKAR